MKHTFGVPRSADRTTDVTELDWAVSEEVSREEVNGSTGRGNPRGRLTRSAEAGTIDWSIGLGIVKASAR
jgi:hypothetical protein